jgi:hypothetical protein
MGGRANSLPLTKYSRINHSRRGFTHFKHLNPAHRGRVPILLLLQSIAAKIHEPSMQFPQYNCRVLYPRVSKPLQD